MKQILCRIVSVMLTLMMVSACATATPEPTATPTYTPTPAPTATVATNATSGVDPEATVTASGLQYIEVQAGTGAHPQVGEIVSVHYTGMLEDGTIFDSSYNRGEPLQFSLGQGQVIEGWDEGIAMMAVGGQAKLIIPPELAYGEAGAGEVIPPDATLIFEVELVAVKAGSPADPTVVEEKDYVLADSGLKYYDFIEGSGDIPSLGDIVTSDFTVWLEDGTKLDSSIDRGEPLVFQIGANHIIPGWEEGIVSMQVGGQRQLVVPPELGYGEEGLGDFIPPNTTLIFEVELLDTREGPPASPKEIREELYETTESGLKYYDLEVGDGLTPETGQLVSVHYTGWLTDGLQFDSSLLYGEPFTFALGAGEVIDGWEEGMATMKVGGLRQLVVPAELGYGATGAGDIIPPNATLIFEVELLEIQ
ncbi:MAG: FKBP-type peptidyl-prolyl cis-trans isomerase [Anaerolineae bacterium]|nr:FKBP-type peptidyl-prolyl cis-trans isomerase [Anaerolineae bacterium]